MLWLSQIVILVVDSTDRERLTLTKEELHRMLSHEVRIQLCGEMWVSSRVIIIMVLFLTTKHCLH